MYYTGYIPLQVCYIPLQVTYTCYIPLQVCNIPLQVTYTCYIPQVKSHAVIPNRVHYTHQVTSNMDYFIIHYSSKSALRPAVKGILCPQTLDPLVSCKALVMSCNLD